MTWVHGARLVLLVSLCRCVSLQVTGTLEVMYPRKTIVAAEGKSVTLTCKANYDFTQCNLVQVAWCRLSSQCDDLTDPSRYLTTVNETVLDGSMRQRQVVTEIVRLTLEDNGTFQCNAACDTGDDAKGHFIKIIVEGSL
ncbi:uncharacterized protein ACJ7VT_020604 [Polymixia lowei]